MFKLKKEIRRKVLPLLLGLVIVLGAFGCQAKKIKDLESQVNTKTEQKVEVKTTKLYENTIRSKFNEMQEYTVESSMINFKHSMNWEDDGFMMFKKRAEITAFADVSYQYKVSLKNVNIIEDENSITVYIDEPVLDKDTLHVESDSIQFIDSSTNYNILTTKEDSSKVMNEFIKSLEKEAMKRINRYYTE